MKNEYENTGWKCAELLAKIDTAPDFYFNVEINFSELKKLLKGEWKGEGFAKFPTIETPIIQRYGALPPMTTRIPFITIKEHGIRMKPKKMGKLFFGIQVSYC